MAEDKDAEIERKIKKEGNKPQPKDALPQIRGRIRAKEEKGKKQDQPKRGGRGKK